MRVVLTVFVLVTVAFALGAQWYIAFDVYATQGADAANGYFAAAFGMTILVALFGGIAAASVD